MRKEIALSGFVLTADEWESLDEVARAQLLAVALHRDEPWIAPAPPAKPAEEYESYVLVFA